MKSVIFGVPILWVWSNELVPNCQLLLTASARKVFQLSLGSKTKAYNTAISVALSSEWISFCRVEARGAHRRSSLLEGCWSALPKGVFGDTLDYQLFLPLIITWTERNGAALSTCTLQFWSALSIFPKERTHSIPMLLISNRLYKCEKMNSSCAALVFFYEVM